VVPSLAVTDTGTKRVHSPLRLLEQALMVVAMLALVASVVVGFVPVTNPGVQNCGSPFVFSWRTTNDVVLPAPGSPSAPPNVTALLAQQPCHQRVDRRLLLSGLAVALAVVTGLLGAVVGLLDDRAGYRRSPRFETFLRERPLDAPSDPWDLPVVPEPDLGERLPDIEWREVRVVVGVGIATAFVLVWLATWHQVHAALSHVSPGWIVVAVLLVVSTYPIAAGAILAAADDASRGRRPFGPLLATAVASSFTGRLLPEYGAAGLSVHQLIRSGTDRVVARRDLAAIASVALVVHGGLVVLVGAVALAVGQVAAPALRWEWVVWVFVAVMIAVGCFDGPRRYATLVVRPDRRSFADLGRLASDPVRLAGIAASCLVLALVNSLVLFAATRAFGATGAAAPVLAVGLIVAVMVVVAPTPDGAGLVEAVMVLGLIWAGVGAGAAVATMILVRVLAFWLPMLPGWIVLRRLERRGVL
jgi:uncharacterized membrane protein YbhN (UPF0104 family)